MAENPYAPGYTLLDYGYFLPWFAAAALGTADVVLLVWGAVIAARTKAWDKLTFSLGAAAVFGFAAMMFVSNIVSIGPSGV